jgi:glycerol-3-phosphate O-acyltransferase
MKSAAAPNESKEPHGWLGKFLRHTHHYFGSYLPDRIGRFGCWMLRLFYSGIKIDEAQTNVIREIAPQATIIYATKFKNDFEYLFYYTRYKQLHLPYPQLGFDYRILFWQPLGRLARMLVAKLDYFYRHRKLPDPYQDGYYRQQLINGKAGFLALVGRQGFYRRFVKSETDPIAFLINLQKSMDRPLVIVPQLMFFSKKPHRAIPSLIDVLFGPEHKPGTLRRLYVLFKKPDKVFVEVSRPLNLREYLARGDLKYQTTGYQSLILRRDLLLQFNRHRQRITGPVLKSRQEIKENILTTARVQDFIASYAENRELSIQEVRKKADGYLEEIAAQYNPSVLTAYSAVVGWIIGAMFEGVTINDDVLTRVKHKALQGPLIFIPCHKSHVDYLILSYILFQYNIQIPLIAAGKNLSFWPLGPLFRNGGAFFIRRSFRGAALYARIFSEYIHHMLEEGYNIEQFIEGTRSRTGKLLMPKLGLLSILLNAYKNRACQDMVIIPTYIGYDRVLEEKAYLHELEGGRKEPESLGQVIRARKFLKKRYGRIYLQFGEPISLNEHLASKGLSMPAMSSKDQNTFCRELGFRIIHSITQAGVVTPHALVASAILNCLKAQISRSELTDIIAVYLSYLSFVEAKLSDTLIMDQQHAIDQAVEVYTSRKFIEKLPGEADHNDTDTLFAIHENKRPSLEYYKNNCIAFFIPAAFSALSILQKDAFQFAATDLHNEYRFFQNFFRHEFAYDQDRSAEYLVRKTLKAFIDEAALIPHQTLPDTYNVTSAGYRKLRLFAAFLKPFFESYWIVLNHLMRQSADLERGRKNELKKITSRGERMLKAHQIERKESLSEVNYKNALAFFSEKGIKSSKDTEKIEVYRRAIQKALDALRA